MKKFSFNDVKTWLEQWKKSGKLEMGIVVGLVIVIAVLALCTLSFGGESENTVNPTQDQNPKDTKEENLETRLSKVLTAIAGAGNVQILITYESGTEIIPIINTDTQINETQETDSQGGMRTTKSTTENNQTVTIQQEGGSQTPLLLKEKMPEIKGVIVIAQGAGDIRVRLNLLKAVQTALQISGDKIEVFPMEGYNTPE